MANKVLYITSSVIPVDKSFSIELGRRFLKHYKATNPGDEIIELNLNDLPMAQKTLNVHNMSTFFNETDSDFYINQLKNVQKVVFTCPMMNFSVSTIAKNYLDHILVAKKTFAYKYDAPGGSVGYLDHLKVQLLSTQGAPLGWYPWGDHVAYLKGTWEFVGAQVTDAILVDGTKIPENSHKTPQQLIDEYDAEIQTKAKAF